MQRSICIQVNPFRARWGRLGGILWAALLFPAIAATAQSVVGAGGGSGSAGGNELGWTIGEPVVATVGEGTGGDVLTQGFQQPWADVGIGVEEHPGLAGEIRIYPNPVARILNVELPGAANAEQFLLLDAAGRTVLETEARNAHTELDLAGFSTGSYHLRISDHSGKSSRTYKIIINH